MANLRVIGGSLRLQGFQVARLTTRFSPAGRGGLVLRTKKPIYEFERILKGRAGMSQTTRPYRLYVFRPEGVDSLLIDGREFVKYAEEYLDVGAAGSTAKSSSSLIS
jgi:hypothetical protein